MPPYAAAILIYWLALYSLPPLREEYAPFRERLPYYLTFMPEYAHTSVFTIFVHTWIIGVETKFYLLFPPIVFLLIKNPRLRLSLTAATVVSLAAQGQLLLMPMAPFWPARCSPRYSNGRALTRSARRPPGCRSRCRWALSRRYS